MDEESTARNNPALEYASTCVLPTTWTSLPLVNKYAVNHDTKVFEFGLGALGDDITLQLPVCACLLMRAPGQEHASKGGGDAIRPYTPVSNAAMRGKFQLLVKVYQEWGSPQYTHSYKPAGAVSNYLDTLPLNTPVDFKHIPKNIKCQYPFPGVASITMIAVGAGIAPMIQALHSLLGTPGDETLVTLIYGNRTVKDILMREQLDQWQQEHAGRFKVVHCVGSRYSSNVRVHGAQPTLPDGFGELCHPRLAELLQERKALLWRCGTEQERDAVEEAHFHKHRAESAGLAPVADLGWVNHIAVRKHAFPPSRDTRVFVCGLPAVYECICGPREEAGVAPGTALHKLGYTGEQVVKF